MLWNISTIDRQERQGTSFPNEQPKVVKPQELAQASPAFDAWLQAYRRRLEQACMRTDSRTALEMD